MGLCESWALLGFLFFQSDTCSSKFGETQCAFKFTVVFLSSFDFVPVDANGAGVWHSCSSDVRLRGTRSLPQRVQRAQAEALPDEQAD